MVGLFEGFAVTGGAVGAVIVGKTVGLQLGDIVGLHDGETDGSMVGVSINVVVVTSEALLGCIVGLPARSHSPIILQAFSHKLVTSSASAFI